MPGVRDVVMNAECKKYALRQDSKTGHFVLSVLIHPNDIHADLLSAHIGQRMQIAFVFIGDDEQPHAGQETDEGNKAVAQAGMLCRSPGFQKWVIDTYNPTIEAPTEERAALEVCGIVDIKSRAELKTNADARSMWNDLVRDYYSEINKL